MSENADGLQIPSYTITSPMSLKAEVNEVIFWHYLTRISIEAVTIKVFIENYEKISWHHLTETGLMSQSEQKLSLRNKKKYLGIILQRQF